MEEIADMITQIPNLSKNALKYPLESALSLYDVPSYTPLDCVFTLIDGERSRGCLQKMKDRTVGPSLSQFKKWDRGCLYQ